MPRDPTPAEKRALRRFLDSAGSKEEFNRWIDAALKEGKQRRGRKKYKLGIPLDDLLRVLEPPKGVSRTEAIRQLTRNYHLGEGIEQSTVERLRREVKGFERESGKTVIALRDAFKDLDRDLDALRDLIRARIKSRSESLQDVNARGYTSPSDTQSDRSKDDTPRSRALSPPKRTRPRQS
jgi:hypothetical protein